MLIACEFSVPLRLPLSESAFRKDNIEEAKHQFLKRKGPAFASPKFLKQPYTPYHLQLSETYM